MKNLTVTQFMTSNVRHGLYKCELIQILCCSLRAVWIKHDLRRNCSYEWNSRNPYSYRTRISVNGCHWNTCKL